MMPWTFADCDGSSVEAEEGFGCGTDELGIGIHRFSWNVFNHVGLQENRFSADVHIEELKSFVDEFVKFVRVLVRALSKSHKSNKVKETELSSGYFWMDLVAFGRERRGLRRTDRP